MILDGKVAIVTGGATSIGAEIARTLRRAQASVVIADVNVDAGKQLANDLGSDALFVLTDVTDDAQIDRCIDTAITRFGGVDVLINNACSYADRGFESTRQEWVDSLNTNIVSGAVFTQKVVPAMRARSGGVIVNMASVAGKFGTAQRALYPASKAAILQVTKNAAATFAQDNIRVVSVSPAWTWSPAVERLAGSREQADRVGRKLHPLGRIGEPRDIANLIAYLCSADAAFITGADFAVDGGYSMLGPDQGVSARDWFGAGEK
jgi:NAD(P)-dependent dehydrogenase (short-subunit alcohol dehydrogenase family)